jgi:hypothetical protein
MAGKRHHIIPRFLQKGFSSKVAGDQIFTWVFRKNSKPFETNTINSNAENHFYGKEGDLNADDEMTGVETYKFSPIINKLRDGNYDFNKSSVEIAELIAHFSVRTKTIRKGFEQMSDQMTRGIKDVLTDDNIISNVLLKTDEKQISSIFDEALNDSNPELDDALKLLQIFGLDKDNVKDLVVNLTLSNLQNEETKEETKDFVKDIFSEMFNGISENLPESIRKGHIKSLTENTVPLPRVTKYEQLNWNIYKIDSVLILGDTACIFREAGNKSFKPSCDIEKTGQIYLPISSNIILIGTLDDEEIETDSKVLNEAIARCSFEQFICSENTNEKTKLIQLIGTNAQLVSDEEIENELDEIKNNVQKIKDGQIEF